MNQMNNLPSFVVATVPVSFFILCEFIVRYHSLFRIVVVSIRGRLEHVPYVPDHTRLVRADQVRHLSSSRGLLPCLINLHYLYLARV